MTDGCVTVADEYGDMVMIPFSRVVYIRNPKVDSRYLPERLWGAEALGFVLDGPGTIVIWITNKKEAGRAADAYRAWSQQ